MEDKLPSRESRVRPSTVEQRQAGELSKVFQSSYAWSAKFNLPEIAADSYLTVAVPGYTGNEGVYAALRVNGEVIGAPRRAPSYPANSWELQVRPVDGNYSYFIPLKPEWVDANFEVILLGRETAKVIKPEVWISRRPIPLSRKAMIIKR